MYRNIRITVGIGLFIILGVVGMFAQTDSTATYNMNNTKNVGEIIIAKDDLISFLEKIASAKKEVMLQDLENSNMLLYNADAYSRSAFSSPYNSRFSSRNDLSKMSRNDLLIEIEGLSARLNEMYGYVADGGGGSSTFFSMPENSQGDYQLPYQNQSRRSIVGALPLVATDNNANGELRWKIDSLQRQVSLLSAPATIVEKQEEIGRLNREIDQAQDSLIASSTLTPEAKEIVKRYGTSEMKVLFDNDVSEVSPSFRSEVENAAIVLKKNPQLGVVLKGYASPVGNPKYNYDLSMRRNESVKRLLIDYGVFPDQISSVFYGEDKTSSPKIARRVDIKFIIK